MFFPIFATRVPKLAKRVAFLRLGGKVKKVTPGDILEYGSSLSYKRLCLGEGDHKPSDLRVEVDQWTTTWYSRSEGDVGGGGYLRRYGNGTFRIHLGTWCSAVDLKNDIEKWGAEKDDDWRFMWVSAIEELERRIIAIVGTAG